MQNNGLIVEPPPSPPIYFYEPEERENESDDQNQERRDPRFYDLNAFWTDLQIDTLSILDAVSSRLTDFEMIPSRSISIWRSREFWLKIKELWETLNYSMNVMRGLMAKFSYCVARKCSVYASGIFPKQMDKIRDLFDGATIQPFSSLPTGIYDVYRLDELAFADHDIEIDTDVFYKRVGRSYAFNKLYENSVPQMVYDFDDRDLSDYVKTKEVHLNFFWSMRAVCLLGMTLFFRRRPFLFVRNVGGLALDLIHIARI